jgi:hypothetical protein
MGNGGLDSSTRCALTCGAGMLSPYGFLLVWTCEILTSGEACTLPSLAENRSPLHCVLLNDAFNPLMRIAKSLTQSVLSKHTDGLAMSCVPGVCVP